MKTKTAFMCTFLLVMLIKPASSQLMSLYDLREEELAFGLGYRYDDNSFNRTYGRIHTGIFSLDYGISDNLKGSVLGGVGWTHVESVDTPLSPILKLNFMSIDNIKYTPLGYFFRNDWGVGYARDIRGHVADLQVTTGTGIFFNIAHEDIRTIKPFVGVFQSTTYVLGDVEDPDKLVCTGKTGIEIEIGQNFSIIGAWDFSFQSSDATFHVGVNFH